MADRTCLACGSTIRGLLASCATPECLERAIDHDTRIERDCDA